MAKSSQLAGDKGSAAPRRTAEQIARTEIGPRPLPALRQTRAPRAPSSAAATTPGGLSVIAVRKASAPMIELRLRIPFGGKDQIHAARAELLADTILLGTATRDREQVDNELASVGGHLSARVGPQRLLISGSVIAAGLPVVLDILAETLVSAAYRATDVTRQRDILQEQLAITGAQPATIAREYLQRKRFGDHPAAFEVPDAGLVASVTPEAVRRLHRRSVLPSESTLVLVGDLSPAAAAQRAATALAIWSAPGDARQLATPPAVTGGILTAHHRAGAVQTQTRLTSAGVLRTDPGYAAAQLANMVFGGYFSSRLVENLREDKGFTYHAHSALEFWPGRSALTISYDTATDAAAALVETRHELGRIALTAPADAEIEAARNYAIGSLAASLATQAGYASMVASLAGSGLDQSWLVQHQKNLRTVTASDIADAAARLFSPAAITGVVIGDLEASRSDFARLDGIEMAS